MKFANYTILIILLIVSHFSYSQKQANNWCFSQFRGLSFNTNPPTVLQGSKIYNLEGASSISDTAGNLLFYSDGVTIWNKNNDTLDGGFKLNGDQSNTQACLIVPLPESNTLYYVFSTNTYWYTLGVFYTIVDMSQNSGLGKVISKNNFIYGPTTEKINATLHKNGKDIWILSHDFKENIFYANLLTKHGINPNPVINKIGRYDTSFGSYSMGQLKIAPSGSKIAMVTEENYLAEIYDFDNCSGLMSNPISIDFLKLNGYVGKYMGGQYGVEFSPNENYLYISSAELLYQFDLQYKTEAELIQNKYQTKPLQQITGGQYFSLQIAPDQKVYVARSAGFHEYGRSITVINNPNNKGEGINLDTNYLVISEPNGLSLPNFLSSYFYFKEHIEYKNLCYKDSTILNLKNVDLANIKTVNWYYTNTKTTNEILFSNANQAKYSFPEVDKYSIRANITTTNDSVFDLSTTFNIVSPHFISPSLDNVICKGDSLVLDFGKYCELKNTWKSIDNSITYNTQYALKTGGVHTISYNLGDCLVKDTINLIVLDAKPVIGLVEDTLVCSQFTDHGLLSVHEPYLNSYKWQDGSILSTFNAKNSGLYYVTCENACGVNTDSVNVIFENNPIVNLGPDVEICESESVVLATAEKYNSYTWSNGSPNSSLEVSNTGNYFLTVKNSCGQATDSVFINNVKVSDLFIPNIITPNHDNLNEVFKVGKHLENCKLIIVNRWGDKVYEKDKYDNTWGGVELSDGVYFYEFTNTCFNKDIKGWVQIAR